MLRAWVFGPLRPAGGYRLRPTAANGAPAFIFGATDGRTEPLGVQVLEIGDGGLRGIIVFLDRALAARFAPERLSEP
jgi:hypothetical protein